MSKQTRRPKPPPRLSLHQKRRRSTDDGAQSSDDEASSSDRENELEDLETDGRTASFDAFFTDLKNDISCVKRVASSLVGKVVSFGLHQGVVLRCAQSDQFMVPEVGALALGGNASHREILRPRRVTRTSQDSRPAEESGFLRNRLQSPPPRRTVPKPRIRVMETGRKATASQKTQELQKLSATEQRNAAAAELKKLNAKSQRKVTKAEAKITQIEKQMRKLSDMRKQAIAEAKRAAEEKQRRAS